MWPRAGRRALSFRAAGVPRRLANCSPCLPPEARDDVAQTLLSVLRPEPPAAEGLQFSVAAKPAQTRVSVPHRSPDCLIYSRFGMSSKPARTFAAAYGWHLSDATRSRT